MTLFHPWLVGLIVTCFIVAAGPTAARYLAIPGHRQIERLIGYREDGWMHRWLQTAILPGLVELGRWLPWSVIRALPELAVLVFSGAVIGAYLNRPRYYKTEEGGAGVEFNGKPRALLTIGVKFAGASLLIWIGGQFF